MTYVPPVRSAVSFAAAEAGVSHAVPATAIGVAVAFAKVRMTPPALPTGPRWMCDAVAVCTTAPPALWRSWYVTVPVNVFATSS